MANVSVRSPRLTLARAESAFVPSGTSGWELGVDQDPRRKAEDEYRKRTKDSLGLEKSETTLVFVTPRVSVSEPEAKPNVIVRQSLTSSSWFG